MTFFVSLPSQILCIELWIFKTDKNEEIPIINVLVCYDGCKL